MYNPSHLHPPPHPHPSQMEDTLWAALTDTYAKLPMALTAEKLAEQYGISREECDAFALSSQQQWATGGWGLVIVGGV